MEKHIPRDSGERMTATLQKPDGTFVQVSDWANSLGEMEDKVTSSYILGETGKSVVYPNSVIHRIVRDALAEELPVWQHIGD